MDYTTIQNAATKIVNNINSIDDSINALQNKQDIISTSDMSMVNSHDGKLKIEEIGGKCEQVTTTGKNLLRNTATSTTGNGITYIVNPDGSIDANGAATDTRVLTINTLTLPEGDYILSGNDPSIYGLGDLRVIIGENRYTDYGDGVMFTVSDDTAEISVRCFIYNGATINNKKFYPMIRLASIADPTYEPYTGGIPAPNPDYPQEIKKVVVNEVKTRGKNILNHIVSSQTASGLEVKASKELITVSGTNSSAVTISVCDTTIKNTKGLFVKAPKVRSGINYIARVHRGDSISYLHVLENGLYIPAGGDIGRLYLQQNTVNTTIDLELEPQIVEGFEDSIFEPYTESTIKLSEPIELYGIGDVKDTIEDGKVVRRIGKVIFDGSSDEDWQSMITKIDGKWRNTTRYIRTDTKCYSITDAANLYCSHYNAIPSNTNGTWGCYQGMCIDNSGILMVYDENYNTSDVSIWLAHLAANPMTVVYELAEPVTEPLPAVDQIALNSLSTYDTITYLDFDSEIEPTFQAEYGVTEMGGRVLEDLMTGLNSEILAQSDADRITVLESTIVNNIQD